MSTVLSQGGKGRNICPTCQRNIILKPVGDSLLSFDTDGTVHRCWPSEPRAIGPAVMGKTIKNFSLKKRRITLMLSDGSALEISATSDTETCPNCQSIVKIKGDLVVMDLRLISSAGIVEEKL